MSASLNAAVAFVAAVIVGGCQTKPRVITLTPGGRNVRVVYDQRDVAADCRAVGQMSAEDGITEGPGHYDGTEERAVLKLRNSAADAGANLILFSDPQHRRYPGYVVVEIVLDCAECGQTVTMFGTAYTCE